jgi:hypothetical protein
MGVRCHDSTSVCAADTLLPQLLCHTPIHPLTVLLLLLLAAFNNSAGSRPKRCVIHPVIHSLCYCCCCLLCLTPFAGSPPKRFQDNDEQNITDVLAKQARQQQALDDAEDGLPVHKDQA